MPYRDLGYNVIYGVINFLVGSTGSFSKSESI